jgi:protein-tyrosine phosphatase
MPFSQYDIGRDYLKRAVERGVSCVVCLVPREEAYQKTGLDLLDYYQQAGLQVIHTPIRDFDIPRAADMQAAVEATIVALSQGVHILVHCHAGIGRTGTFLACLVSRSLELDGREAVIWLRQYIPSAVENTLQEAFVQEFCKIGQQKAAG